jgi:Ca-activated chloride channel family protein
VSFDQPLALLALLAIPALVAAYVVFEQRRRAAGARFATLALLPNLVERVPSARRHLPVAILLVALTAMIFGVARPHANLTVSRKEATIILALDVSRSMTATDVRPTRLQAARNAAAAFLD